MRWISSWKNFKALAAPKPVRIVTAAARGACADVQAAGGLQPVWQFARFTQPHPHTHLPACTHGNVHMHAPADAKPFPALVETSNIRATRSMPLLQQEKLVAHLLSEPVVRSLATTRLPPTLPKVRQTRVVSSRRIFINNIITTTGHTTP